MNTELMSSSKWVKLFKDIGAIQPAGTARALCQLYQAEADIIFRKVLHACEHGGNRLTYDLFCKALYLAARAARSDLDGEAAYAELIARIIAAAPEDERKAEKDSMLDAKNVLVLEFFKPALHDLFQSYSSRNLANPSCARRGLGTVRIRERTYLKSGSGSQIDSSSVFRDDGSFMSRGNRSFGPHSPSSIIDVSGIGEEAASASLQSSGTLLGGSLTAERSMACSSAGDSCLYENGVPVITHRRRHMSVDQFLAMCTELKIMPDMLSRVEVVRAFKQAQLSGSASNHGSSIFGYLSQDAFVEAAALLAVQAYSKPPYCDDCRMMHERIQEFLLHFLPRSSRELHDRFRYGRTFG
jgi:hypothetical protein